MKRLKYLERKPVALDMVRGGASGAAAARALKLHSSTLYKDKDYRQIMADRAKEKTDAT